MQNEKITLKECKGKVQKEIIQEEDIKILPSQLYSIESAQKYPISRIEAIANTLDVTFMKNYYMLKDNDLPKEILLPLEINKEDDELFEVANKIKFDLNKAHRIANEIKSIVDEELSEFLTK